MDIRKGSEHKYARSCQVDFCFSLEELSMLETACGCCYQEVDSD